MTTSASAVSMVRNASEKEMGNGDFHKVIIQKKKKVRSKQQLTSPIV